MPLLLAYPTQPLPLGRGFSDGGGDKRAAGGGGGGRGGGG